MSNEAQQQSWDGIGERAIANAEKMAASAYDVRQAVTGLYPDAPVGVWQHPETGHLALEVRLPVPAAQLLSIKAAAETVAPVDGVLQLPEAYDQGWVKVAESIPMRRIGQFLNFIPGQSDGIPNSAGPIQSALTTGLLGAGLGYGAGALAEHLMPERWERGRLRKTLALLGGAVGAAPGALWMMNNVSSGIPFYENRLFTGPAAKAPETPQPAPETPTPVPGSPDVPVVAGLPGLPELPGRDKLNPNYRAAGDRWASKFGEFQDWRAAELTDFLDLADPADSQEKSAEMDTVGIPAAPETDPLVISTKAIANALGRYGNDPATAGVAGGVLTAAARMPGGTGDDGWVTPWQMGELAAHMGSGWLSGMLVGRTLGLLSGMPQESQENLARIGMYSAVVKTIVPKLFGF